MPTSAHPDAILVEAIRRGKPEAWSDLISQYEGRLLSFVGQASDRVLGAPQRQHRQRNDSSDGNHDERDGQPNRQGAAPFNGHGRYPSGSRHR